MKKNISQYIVGVGLALLVSPILDITLMIFSDIGWDILVVLYLSIIFLQILFYFFTTNFNISWTILSFLINFILWSIELVTIEKIFHNTFLFQDENFKMGILILGGLIWVTNKILIDILFNLRKSLRIKRNKLEIILS